MVVERNDRYHMTDATGEDITLTDQQRRCVDYDSKTALVIKGTAGSGKSLMIIKRAMEYRKAIPDSHRNVVVFTYNVSLAEGIRYVLQENGVPVADGSLSVTTVDSYLSRICVHMNLIPKAVVSGNASYSSRYNGGYQSGNEFNAMTEDKERVTIMKGVLADLSKKGDHPYYHRDPQVWVDEVMWMYRNGIVDGDDEGVYLDISREGRCKNYTMHLSKKGRKVVMNIFNGYNMTLFNRRRFEWERLYALLLRNLGDIPDSVKVDYMLIDEAQDLSLVKMLILKHLCRGELNVAMDKNQSIYGHRWSFKRDLGINVHVKTLEVMHRGTREIDAFSADLKRIDDTLLEEEDRYQNEMSPQRSGELPEVVKCSSTDAEMEFIINEIKAIMSSESNMANIAILCTNYANLSAFEQKLKRNGIPVQHFKAKGFKALEPGVKLITIHSAKGLGFIYVFIPYLEEGVFPKSVESIIASINKSADAGDGRIDIEDAIDEEMSESRRLLYVAVTRARLKVTMTYSGTPSRFLKDFDPTHYSLVDESHQVVEDDRITGRSPETRTRPTLASELGSPEVNDTGSTLSPEPDIGSDDPLAVLEALGIEYVDNRAKGTVLWFLKGPNSDEALRIFRAKGYNPMYSECPRATQRRPAYYMR